MKDKIKKIKNILILDKFQSESNLRKLCLLVGITNLITCIIFYWWFIVSKNTEQINRTDHLKNLLIVTVLSHTYLNIILIRWTKQYPEAKWKMWSWLSLLCVTPLGISLIFLYNDEQAWKENRETAEKPETMMNSLTNSVVNLTNSLNKSIDFLNNTYPEDFKQLLANKRLDIDNLESWLNKDKYFVIALYEGLKSKKTNFSDIDFHARWYEQRFFDFAIIDPKKKIMPHIRYQYSIGFIVLDEFNNYQKILNGKKEIKNNIRFGTAKVICLHWGKGFKTFVNE